MTPEDLATRHPRLYHLTEPGAVDMIRQHGLLSTLALLDLFEIHGDARTQLTKHRRPGAIPVHHPRHGTAILNDNLPLSEAALIKCLQDGLTPRDWLRHLNDRAFFWPDEAGLASLLKARINRGRPRAVLTFDTLSLARAHWDRLELSPINGGSTIRKAAMRGKATYTRAHSLTYDAWRRLRGRLDRVREVAIPEGVRDARDHLLEVEVLSGG